MKDVVTILERWYPTRVERYVVLGDRSLMPLEIWRQDPFVLVSTERKPGGTVGNVEAGRK